MNKLTINLRSIYLLLAFCSGVFCLGFSLLLFWTASRNSGISISWPVLFAFAGIGLLYSIRFINKISEKKVNGAISKYKCDNFSPTPGYELKNSDTGKYVGIDTVHGTILLVSTFDSTEHGTKISELSGYECAGSTITLKFNNVYFPYFVISSSSETKSIAFCHKLDVLLSPSYKPQSDTGASFSQFVQNKSIA